MDEQEESTERLPETEYPTHEDAMGVGFGEEPLVPGTPDVAEQEVESEDDAESPNFEQQANEKLPITDPIGPRRGRKATRPVGRPRNEENFIGIVRRWPIPDAFMREYVLKRCTDIVDRLHSIQGCLYPEQDLQLLGYANMLMFSVNMQAEAKKNPALQGDHNFISEFNRLQSAMQRSLKMLGLYAAPKTKPDKAPKKDIAALLHGVKVRQGKRK